MGENKDKEVQVRDSQAGVIADSAHIEGGIHFGKTVQRNVITIQNITVYRSQPAQLIESSEPPKSDIGPNPYLGLGAFQEQDADRFFGREKLTQTLWEKFRDLNEPGGVEKRIRLLPIIGPSGSGKSSVARAGLIPELARNPLPGYSRARVGILTPGNEPVQALAGILARMATGDTIPAAKAREFAGELIIQNDKGQFDGLARIAGLFPDIHDAPLIILADQFEEVYSLCEDADQRNCFIDNLLHAASDNAGYVSVILTLRSDFLGETQTSEVLNRAIAENGEIIPTMNRDELRLAVTMPAQNAGHPLDDALVNLLVEETRDREGALPLLQFALTRIWEGMADGKNPSDTLTEIGGVGGALAGEARRLFNALADEDQMIVRRAFLSMVTLGEGTKDTRRRVRLDRVAAGGEDMARVKKLLEFFSGRGARLITLSGEEGSGAQTVEMTHEALLEHWQDLRSWLDENRDAIRLQRRLETAAEEWEAQGRPPGLLWRPPNLDRARALYTESKEDFSGLQTDFYRASERALTKKRFWVALTVGLIVVGIAIAFYLVKKQERTAIANERKANYNLAHVYEEKAGIALDAALKGKNSDENFQKAWLYTLEALNQEILSDKALPVSVKRLGMKEIHLGLLRGVGVRQDNRYAGFASEDKTIRRWESNLPGAFSVAGKSSPEFRAAYRCSFDLFPFRMEEITLVPVKDGPPVGAQPWYARYLRPSRKDPVQWMIESTANAIYEKKLTVKGIPASWAASRMRQLTAQSTDVAWKPEAVTTEAGMTFVYIQPGSFFMGSPLEEVGRYNGETFHMVTISKGFYLQTKEVTQGQWKTVMGKNRSRFDDCGNDCPVESVSWEDTQKFINVLNKKGSGTYRLPTEAEWEYACRAGTTTRYHTGDSDTDLDRAGWYDRNSGRKPHPVGEKKSNAFGLYDMHGNMWEWCEDDWHLDYNGAPHDGSAWVDNPRGSYRVLRGGSWYNRARDCRAAVRRRHYPGGRGRDFGFRLVFLPGQQQ